MTNPRLRFKKPDGAAYPDWETVQLGDIATRVTRKNKDGETDVPLTMASIEGLVDQRSYFGKTIASKDMSGYFLLKNGEFAYNKSYSAGYDYGAIKRLDKYDRGALSTLYICFALNDLSWSDFMVQYFDSLKWNAEMPKICAEGARNHGLLNVAPTDFFKISMSLPTDPEERDRIVAGLRRITERIECQSLRVAALETQKKELLRQVFAREIRFKDENGQDYPEWEEMTVGQLFYRKNARNRNGDNTNVITNSAEFGLIPQRDYFDKNIAVDGKTENYYVIEKGDFVYNPRKSVTAPFGPFNCYLLEDAGIVSPLYTCLTPLDHRYSAYLLWYFQSPYWYDYIRLNGAQGGARHDRVGMTNELMDGIPVLLPSLPEQKRIADFFTALDAQIENERALLEDWRQLKKGLLQQMFV